MTADAAYANAANAAAAAFAGTPPFVSYRLRLSERHGDISRDDRFDVAYRSSDGKAKVASDDGKTRSGDPPALPPAVDALAQWAFALDDVSQPVVMRVAYERPKRYAFATPGPDVDVVASGIAGYSVRFVDGDTAHLALTPATPDVRAFAEQPDDFVVRDVFLDGATPLPRRVVLVAPGETLTLDYAMQRGAWLLSHVTYEGRRGTRAAAARESIDATYDAYDFPAPEPR